MNVGRSVRIKNEGGGNKTRYRRNLTTAWHRGSMGRPSSGIAGVEPSEAFVDNCWSWLPSARQGFSHNFLTKYG